MLLKRVSIPLIFAMVLTLLSSTIALAQADLTEDLPEGVRRGIGRVTNIDERQISVDTLRGEPAIMRVDENTRYRDPEGEELFFDDLEIGTWVAGLFGFEAEAPPVSRMVIILPEDFDPSQGLGRKAQGVVIEVDPVGNVFSVHTSRGENLTFQVNEKTRYRGDVAGLSELEEGMHAWVGAIQQEDTSLLALVIMARFPMVNYLGKVASVDPGNDTFEFQTRGGENLVVTIDEMSRFRSPDGSLGNLQDLKPEMIALVVAKRESNGTLLASLVAAGNHEHLADFELRTMGEVLTVTEDSFEIEARDGQRYTFQVNDDTRFRSWGVQVKNIADLTEGIKVWVGAKELANGRFQAQLVLAGLIPKP